jgi:chemotaxis protein histidine kinase CheA
MFDLGVLDIIISIVVVLLVLSLIVQSIQSLLKKILKLKSSSVFSSMEDLFKYIDTQTLVGKSAEQLVADVTAQFKELGRVSLITRRPMLDSISKGDLQKILEKLHGDKLKAQVENWFDTVMQGFDERYTRHMKTIALVISFVVVIFLNANFFNIYRNIAESDIRRAEILQKGQALLDRLKEQESTAAGNQDSRQSSSSTGARATPAQTPSARKAEAGAAAPTPIQSPSTVDTSQTNKEVKEEIKQNAEELQQYVNDYKGLGFTPLRLHQVSDFISGHGYWEGRPFSERFAHGARVLIGWSIMALLLSVGAPFWQDTLESLFGLKGLIRKKSQTQNVEEGAGTGQPKP